MDENPISFGTMALFPEKSRTDVKRELKAIYGPQPDDINLKPEAHLFGGNMHFYHHVDEDKVIHEGELLLRQSINKFYSSQFKEGLEQGSFGTPLVPTPPIDAEDSVYGRTWAAKFIRSPLGTVNINNDLLQMADTLCKKTGMYPNSTNRCKIFLAVPPKCYPWLLAKSENLSSSALDVAKSSLGGLEVVQIPELECDDGNYGMMVVESALHGRAGYFVYDTKCKIAHASKDRKHFKIKAKIRGLIITNPKQIVVMKGI